MAVISKTKRWLNSRVPYVVDPASDEINKWVIEINKALGYDLLVAKGTSDINYIKVAKGGGKSESIGCLSRGAQTVSANQKRSMQHEILHALGFHHEQLHKGFPWNDDDPTISAVNRMFSWKDQMTTDWNKELWSKLSGGTLGGQFYADNNLMSRVQSLLDANVESYDKCDFDSIMMYPDCKKAVEAALVTYPTPTINGTAYVKYGSGQDPKAPFLSKGDVKAILHMYPRRA